MMMLVLYSRFKDRITDMQTEVWMPPTPHLKDLIKTKYVIISSKLGLVSSSFFPLRRWHMRQPQSHHDYQRCKLQQTRQKMYLKSVWATAMKH